MTALAAQRTLRETHHARFRDIAWSATFALLAAAGGVAAVASPRMAFALAGVFVLGWLAVAWRAGVAVLLVLACVDGFIKKLFPSTGTYLLKDAVLIAVVLGTLAHASRGNWVRHALADRRAWPVVFYLVAMTAMLANPGIGIMPAIAGYRERVLFTVLFFVGTVYFDSGRRFVRTWSLVIGGIAFASLVAIVQMAMGGAWARLGPAFARAAMHYNSFNVHASAGQSLDLSARAYGSLVDPQALGLATGFGIVLGCASIPFARGRTRYALMVAIFSMTFALMFSGARAGMVTAAIGFLVLLVAFMRRGETRPYAMLALIVVLCAVPFGYSMTAKANAARFAGATAGVEAGYRLKNIAEAANRLTSRPFGAGLGSTGAGGALRARPADTLRGLDNLFVAYLYEVGPLGLIAFTGTQLWILIAAFKRARAAATLHVACIYNGLAAAQIGLLANGLLSQGSFDYAPVAQAFWLFAGSVLVAPRILETAHLEKQPCPS